MDVYNLLNNNIATKHYMEGVSRMNKDDFTGAIQLFSKAIEICPDKADPYLLRGKCYYHKNKLNKAIKDYKRAFPLFRQMQIIDRDIAALIIVMLDNCVDIYKKKGEHKSSDAYRDVSNHLKDALDPPHQSDDEFNDQMYAKQIYLNITDENVRNGIDHKFHRLYHAVSVQHQAAFESGDLWLDSASNIRTFEDTKSIYKDINREGTDISASGWGDIVMKRLRSCEYFVFCLSTTPDIKEIREKLGYGDGKPRVLYEVDTQKLLSAIAAALTEYKAEISNGSCRFGYTKKDKLEANDIAYEFTGGAVKYVDKNTPQGKKTDIDICFNKSIFFNQEDEFRLVLMFVDNINHGKVNIKINASGWYKKK